MQTELDAHANVKSEMAWVNTMAQLTINANTDRWKMNKMCVITRKYEKLSSFWCDVSSAAINSFFFLSFSVFSACFCSQAWKHSNHVTDTWTRQKNYGVEMEMSVWADELCINDYNSPSRANVFFFFPLNRLICQIVNLF